MRLQASDVLGKALAVFFVDDHLAPVLDQQILRITRLVAQEGTSEIRTAPPPERCPRAVGPEELRIFPQEFGPLIELIEGEVPSDHERHFEPLPGGETELDGEGGGFGPVASGGGALVQGAVGGNVLQTSSPVPRGSNSDRRVIVVLPGTSSPAIAIVPVMAFPDLTSAPAFRKTIPFTAPSSARSFKSPAVARSQAKRAG
jgi:hypothetical protein